MPKTDYAYKDTHHYKLIKPLIHVLKHDELPKSLMGSDQWSLDRLEGQMSNAKEYFHEVYEDGAHPTDDDEFKKWLIELVDENVYYICLGIAGIGPIGIAGNGMNQPLNRFEEKHGVIVEEVNGHFLRFLPGAPTSVKEQEELEDEAIKERVDTAVENAVPCSLEQMYRLPSSVLHAHQVVMSYNMMRRDFQNYDTKRLIEFCDWVTETL